MLLAIFWVVAAAVLFRQAPEGLNAFSLGGLALLGVALVNFSRASAGSLRKTARPLAHALGLRAQGGFGFFSDAHCYLRGEVEGRAVEIRLASSSGNDSGPQTYTLRGTVSARPRPGLTIKLLPKLENAWDRYLEHMPPQLPGSWPAGYGVYGEPEQEALIVLARVPKELLSTPPAAGGLGDAVRLSAGRCRFETAASEDLPAPARVRALLDLCCALAQAAETV